MKEEETETKRTVAVEEEETETKRTVAGEAESSGNFPSMCYCFLFLEKRKKMV